MSICNWCKNEMSGEKAVDNCSGNVASSLIIDGDEYEPIPYEPSFDYEEGHRCHDCNVAVGGCHHPGCDMEECPKCDGQLISCGCLDEEDVNTEDTDEELDKRLQ